MADLIDRQTAIDAILRLTRYDTVRSLYEATVANKYEDCFEDGIMDAIDVIVALPSAQPEQKTGRWLPIPDSYSFFYTIPICSECGCTTLMRTKTPFCPNCGAKMEDGDG